MCLSRFGVGRRFDLPWDMVTARHRHVVSKTAQGKNMVDRLATEPLGSLPLFCPRHDIDKQAEQQPPPGQHVRRLPTATSGPLQALPIPQQL